MKNSYASVLMIIVLATSACTGPRVKDDKPITIAEVVAEIEKAMADVKLNAPASLPAFDSAEVQLETTAAQENGGTLKLLVVSLGSKTSKGSTQTVSFKLKSPTVKKALAPKPIHEALAKAIVAAASEFQAANTKLQLHDLSASIKFEVSKTGSGEVGFDIGSATLGGSHSRTSGASHSITLNYVMADNKE